MIGERAGSDRRFEELQANLVPLWGSMSSLTQDEQTIVVVPSFSLDLPPGVGQLLPLLEERFLFLLLLLRQPRARVVYVSSRRIAPEVIDYYLGLLPGVIPSHARARLFVVPVEDMSDDPLSAKVLARPKIIERIRSLILDPSRAHMVPYVTSELERELALELGIPLYGSDPRLSNFGTKSGARKLFAELGVPHPRGVEDLGSLEEASAAIERLHRDEGATRFVVKLNEGVSGLGNGNVDIGSDGDAAAAMKGMRLPEGTIEGFAEGFARQGGIVEQRLEGKEFRSPSVQMRITPLGDLEVLSTHDQLLGGIDGQNYEGCIFPADPAYARAITEEAVKVGERLIKEGVLGRFAIDFVSVNDGEGWNSYAIELNLRKGGTTHPYLTLQFLTDGTYDAGAANFIAPGGKAKFFMATDKLHSDAYRGLTVEDLFDAIVRHGLHFDQSRQTGVVLHSMSQVSQFGRLGLTAVGDSREEAADLYARARDAFDSEAART